jgi:hypothetical protein
LQQLLPRQVLDEHCDEDEQELPSDFFDVTHLPELNVYPELHTSQLPLLLHPVQPVLLPLLLQQLLPRQVLDEHCDADEHDPPSDFLA